VDLVVVHARDVVLLPILVEESVGLLACFGSRLAVQSFRVPLAVPETVSCTTVLIQIVDAEGVTSGMLEQR
jgi:hypothetical protein